MKDRDVLAGYYGFGNFGDDLFRDIIVQAMNATTWARPLVSQNNDHKHSKITRNIDAFRNILTARSVTLGGGSILGARAPFGIRHVEIGLTTLKKIPYCALGVGVLEGMRSPPDAMMRRMSWIGLRSEAEFHAFKDRHPQVHYMSDLAYAAAKVLFGGRMPEHRTSEIALAPAAVGQMGQLAKEPDRLRSWLVDNVLPFIKSGNSVKILLMQPKKPDDAALSLQFSDECERLGARVRRISHSDTVRTIEEISSSSFLFTDRLHGGILAHACRVPFYLSKHHAKCVDLLRDIDHPGQLEDSSIVRLGADSISTASQWTEQQDEALARHSDLASAGLDNWLEHIRLRVA